MMKNKLLPLWLVLILDKIQKMKTRLSKTVYFINWIGVVIHCQTPVVLLIKLSVVSFQQDHQVVLLFIIFLKQSLVYGSLMVPVKFMTSRFRILTIPSFWLLVSRWDSWE